MKLQNLALAALVLTLLYGGFPAGAEPLEPSYTSENPRVTTPFYGATTKMAQQADLNFISGMRPHHAGALSMSKDYLGSPDARNAKLLQLARGIIHNQTFEISMLDMVERQITAQSPVAAFGGQAQKLRFFRAPIPGPLDGIGGPRDASVRDVQFAKAMIVHHQAALDMANDYLQDPNAKNPYLRKMSSDILFDQALEIDFMHNRIKTYPGDPALVKIDPGMVHGMDHMQHGQHPAPAKTQATEKQGHGQGHEGKHH